MKLINGLTDTPKQSLLLVLEDQSVVEFTLRFIDNSKGWTYTITYGPKNFQANNRRLVSSPNMLHAFRNILPFGLACVVSDGTEPVFQTDFALGRCKLYILNEADVEQAEAVING